MVDEPNIFEQALKNTSDFVDDNITGKLGNLTDQAAEKLDNKNVKGVLPIAVGGAATLTGILLLQPINWLVKSGFSLVKNVATGFGYLEKIPLFGGLFTMLGKGIDTVGKYAGYAIPAIAGFIGYKAFQSKSRTQTPQTVSEKIDEVIEETSPATQGALVGIAVGAYAGHQSRGQRIELLRNIIQNPEIDAKPATAKQIARLKEMLGEEGFTRVNRELFGTKDTGLTRTQAARLIHQAEGLNTQIAQQRVKAIQAEKPARSIPRAAINRIPGVRDVAEWVSPDVGLSRAERNIAARIEAATPAERAGISAAVADQLIEEIRTAKAALPAPVETPAPARAVTPNINADLDAALDYASGKRTGLHGEYNSNPALKAAAEAVQTDPALKTRVASEYAKALAASDGKVPLRTLSDIMVEQHAAATKSPVTPPPEGLTRRQLLGGRPAPTEPPPVVDAPETPVPPKAPATNVPPPVTAEQVPPPPTGSNTNPAPKAAAGAPPAKPGFFYGRPSPGASAMMGGTAALGSLMVLTDDDASTTSKVVAGTAGAAGTGAVIADYAGAARTAGNLGRAAGAVAVPLNVANAYNSFTKENATGEDYLQGGISTAYAAGGAAMLTGAGFIPGAITVAGAGLTDISHKGYKIATGLHEVGEWKAYIDSGYEPSRDAGAAHVAVQARLRDRLIARGVPQIPWGDGGTLLDIRDPQHAKIALAEIAIARDKAWQRMDQNNISLPRFFAITDNQRKKQNAYEDARADYYSYKQAIKEFDWMVDDQRKRLADHIHLVADSPDPNQVSDQNLGGLQSNAPATAPKVEKDKNPSPPKT